MFSRGIETQEIGLQLPIKRQDVVFVVADGSQAEITTYANQNLITRREFLKTAGVWLLPLFIAGCQRDTTIVERLVTPSVPPTHLPTPTTFPPPSPEKTVEPTLSPEVKPESLFWLILQPFIQEAEKRRSERKLKDKEYTRRVDEELNSGRINFLIFSSGETHEPPLEWGIIASPTSISIDYINKKVDIISLTHDIRAPEVEKVLGTLNKDRRIKDSAQRLDSVLLNEEAVKRMGKWELPRWVFEDATGLSIDFQIHSNDVAIQKFVDNILGGITLDLPIDMPLGPYYFSEGKYQIPILRKKYDQQGRIFPKGEVRLNGRELVGFIKAIPLYQPKIDKEYSPIMEHNFRKALFFDTLLASLKEKFASGKERGQLAVSLAAYILEQILVQDVVYDFDAVSFIVSNLGRAQEILEKFNRRGTNIDLGFPEIRHSLYIVDKCCSADLDKENMPVHWADSIDRPQEEEIKKDWGAGVFDKTVGGQKLAYEVPFGGNPYGDLISEYWQTVRAWVRRRLLGY